jgi:DNA-directed RNA polymerase subunit RPC12/RpoP
MKRIICREEGCGQVEEKENLGMSDRCSKCGSPNLIAEEINDETKKPIRCLTCLTITKVPVEENPTECPNPKCGVTL